MHAMRLWLAISGALIGIAVAALALWVAVPLKPIVIVLGGLGIFVSLLRATTSRASAAEPEPANVLTPVAPDQHDADPEVARVLELLPVGVMIIGADGKIRTFNASAGEIFGVPVERAAHRALIEIVRSFELDRRVTATLRDGAQDTAELSYSGVTQRQLLVTTRKLASADGTVSALVIVADQTRMRELESLRREFVSNVSHELRTPLTAVKLMVETLQSGVEKPASDDFLSSIANETERMIALVEDLLDLARLESGKLQLRLSTVDVTELCREAALAQRQRAQALGVNLECSVPERPITISADRDKLFQVVVNLLDNALRHTPTSGKVTVAASNGGGETEIVVSDSGSGIPSTALPHIFERFYVVDPARARSRSGTGLGLAIVKHIVEAHGGTIAATSELGMGTSFRCTFTNV